MTQRHGSCEFSFPVQSEGRATSTHCADASMLSRGAVMRCSSLSRPRSQLWSKSVAIPFEWERSARRNGGRESRRYWNIDDEHLPLGPKGSARSIEAIDQRNFARAALDRASRLSYSSGARRPEPEAVDVTLVPTGGPGLS